MKNNFILLSCFIFFSGILSAQVGINTANPKRTLDVEGNLRVRELTDKSQAPSYNKILVVNPDGNIDYINKQDLQPVKDEFTADKQVLNNIYSTTTGKADDTKFVSCGKFDFAFRNIGANTNIQYRLKNTPTSNVTVYITLEQNYSSNGYQFQVPTAGKTFTSTTNNFGDLPTYGANIVNSELNVLYLLYPGESNLYRLTFYRLDQTTPKTNDFVTVCEKF
ncbi:hypothetical protein [Algoriella sp.]|uniref:hypothetical protein n=1 Tax=Algoriella sp. TaxID=1872434 RepID=UPI001B158307|nr:hypothetical protein [Algoriella sp.]MBO6213618.1 hypothetical protein [Algoriella sp.]